MNVSEANEFNTLLGWLMGKPTVSNSMGKSAMKYLAQRAYDRLHAGYSDIEVQAWWKREVEDDSPQSPAITSTVTISEHDTPDEIERKVAAAMHVVEHSVAWSFDARIVQ